MDDQTAFLEKPAEPSKVAATQTTSIETKVVETGPPKAHESHIASISIRALIALIVIATVCYMSIVTIEVKEPLYTLAGLIVGFFFGQQTKPKSQTT